MNTYVAICFLLALTASTQADGGLGWGSNVYAPHHASVDYYAYPRYAFEYSVKDPHTGDNKAQWEKRDGDVVKGAYSLVEPGGSIRIVEYWADDKSGFNAVVKRVGPKVHPTGHVPIYKAPIPVLGPYSLGPVSGHGVAVSTASVSKGAPLEYSAPIIKPVLPIAPIIKPVLPIAPIYKPALPLAPIYRPAPIISGPIGLGLGPVGYPGLGLGPVGYPGVGLGGIGGGLKGPLIGGYNSLGLGGAWNHGGPAIGGHDGPWDGSLLGGWKH